MNKGTKKTTVKFQATDGLEVEGALLRLDCYSASFELPGTDILVRTSEALESFRIHCGSELLYAGRAVVRDCIDAGTRQICLVLLDEQAFDAEFFAAIARLDGLDARFEAFLQDWAADCHVQSDFKLAVADIQSFLGDLQRWVDQIDLGLHSSVQTRLSQNRLAVADALSKRAVPVLDDLFGRFEQVAQKLNDNTRPAHRSYIQRHLHPLVLCAPFAYRAFRKPLGYAGDYEMVNMMVRDPREGSSLFAKVFNVWLLHQGAAAAHRNRITLLGEHLLQETLAAVRRGRPIKILNVGCGPAAEIAQFISAQPASDAADFTLLDFNEETLEHVDRILRLEIAKSGRRVKVKLIKKSVQQLLRESMRTGELPGPGPYDFIYCAGLFDYLPDRTCRQLLKLFFDSAVPGGLLLVTNVGPSNPNRGSLDMILDWNLIYRDSIHMHKLVPPDRDFADLRVASDFTGVNLLLEGRRPYAP